MSEGVMLRLRDVAKGGLFCDGDWVESKDQDPNGTIRLLQLADIGDGEFRNKSSRWLRPDQAERIGVTYVQERDILIARMPDPLGRACIVPKLETPSITAVDVAILRAKREDVDPRWLMRWLNSPQTRATIAALASGTTRQRITRKNLEALDLFLPHIDEQRRIVETLDEHLFRIDKALADLEVAANRSHHLFLAALEEAIEECDTTTYQPLQACLNAIDQKKKVQRGWSPQCLSHPQSDSSVWAVLKTTAVQNMRYEPQHNKELPKTLEPKAHLEVQEGDFLMTTTGPRNRCGVVCLVTSTPQKLIFSGKILRFQPDSAKLLPSWLELVLASHKYQKQLDRLKVGSSDSSVSIGNAQVLELTVPVPSLVEQIRLVGNVEKMKALAERFEMEIDQEAQKFKQLRRALLHSAFSGNLGGK